MRFTTNLSQPIALTESDNFRRTAMNELTDSMVSMSNNLHECIKRSGMTVTEVAAAKGVTQATLHRLKSGKVKLGIQDAEHYARILGCTVQEILFQQEPIPVIGEAVMFENRIEREFHNPQKYEVYAKDQYLRDRACFLWKCEEEGKGMWYDWDGAIQFIKHSPIVDKTISKECFQNICIVKTKEPIACSKCDDGHDCDIFGGVLYPQPGGLYTIHNGKSNDTFTDLDLEWATPTLSTVFRPDLLGIHIKTLG